MKLVSVTSHIKWTQKQEKKQCYALVKSKLLRRNRKEPVWIFLACDIPVLVSVIILIFYGSLIYLHNTISLQSVSGWEKSNAIPCSGLVFVCYKPLACTTLGKIFVFLKLFKLWRLCRGREAQAEPTVILANFIFLHLTYILISIGLIKRDSF